MSDTIATNETEQAQAETSQPDRYDTLEAAMQAIGDDSLEDVTEEAEDTPPEDQPEDVEEDAEEEAEEDESEEESDVDGDDQEGDIEALEYDPDVVVTLEDGTESTLEELVNGNLRQADYTRKTEALAEERRSVEEFKASAQTQSEEINRTYQGLVEFLQGIMPPEPSLDLLGHDQSEYLRQQAIRKSFTEELSSVLSRQQDAQAISHQMSQTEMDHIRADEQKKLVKAMPMLADEMKLASFKEGVVKTAVDLGFSEVEIGNAVDHRLLRLVHLAGIGKKSLENGENARRRIKRKAATPAAKAPASKAATRSVSNNGKAMRKLSQSGSITDAMNIDF